MSDFLFIAFLLVALFEFTHDVVEIDARVFPHHKQMIEEVTGLVDDLFFVLMLIGDDDFKLKLVKDIIHGKLVKRGISLKNLKEEKKEAAAGGTVRQVLSLQNGISSDMAKDIVKRVKASKIKVAAKINGDEVRVSSKDKDCLQECIQFLKQQDIPTDLQFVNYR